MEGQTETGREKKSSPKRLRRSDKERLLLGVCGGLGEYFGLDPVLVRVLWVIGVLLTAFLPGVAAYLILAIIMPRLQKPAT